MKKYQHGGPQEDNYVVTFEQYEKLVYENNDIIKWLSVDLSRVSIQIFFKINRYVKE